MNIVMEKNDRIIILCSVCNCPISLQNTNLNRWSGICENCGQHYRLFTKKVNKGNLSDENITTKSKSNI